MKILCIRDVERECELSLDLFERIKMKTETNGHTIEKIDIGKNDIAFCRGCFRCWTNETGICVTKDGMENLNERLIGCDLILILSPVVFGTFSTPIKALVDKGFGNNLFEEKHYPQLIIGFGEDITDAELSCFIDISEKHRGTADVVHPEISDIPVEVWVTRSLSDNVVLADKIVKIHLAGGAV